MILVRNYMCSLMMISDMLSKRVGAMKSVLKKWFKINDIQLVHLLVVWYLVNLQDARCNNKDHRRDVYKLSVLETYQQANLQFITQKFWKANRLLLNNGEVQWVHLYTACYKHTASGLAIASPLASLHEKQRTQIQDMLPQQYYNEKVHIFNTWF